MYIMNGARELWLNDISRQDLRDNHTSSEFNIQVSSFKNEIPYIICSISWTNGAATNGRVEDQLIM